jgi:hypothetical protein
MAKRPAFQFYPSDWLNDLGLRQCSPMARGVWADLLCLMHDGEPYGHLATKSGELTIPWLANRLGMRARNLKSCIVELENFNVFSRNSEGRMYSRRMVRDEELRIQRASGGALSANNPNVPRSKKDIHDGPNEGQGGVPSPSSSSSSSSSSSKNKEQREEAQAPPSAPPTLALVKPSKGTRFTLQPLAKEWAEYAMKKRRWSIEQTIEVYEGFCDHWITCAQPNAIKLNWLAAWRQWVRKERAPPTYKNQNNPKLNFEESCEKVMRERFAEGRPPL